MPHRRRALSWIGLLASVAVPGCGAPVVVAHGVQRIDETHLVETLGESRYAYAITRIAVAAERGPAHLALVPPAGAREIAQVEVTVPRWLSNWEGLRTERSAFFPTLATLAGQLGGTRFVVSHEERVPGYGAMLITLLVTDVYAEP